MSASDPEQAVTFRLRIPTEDYAARYGEAVWRKAQHVVEAAEALPDDSHSTMTLQVPARLALMLDWIAEQQAEDGQSLVLAARIEDLLREVAEDLIDAVARGEHPVLRQMAERAGTWSPPEPVISTDLDDELPF